MQLRFRHLDLHLRHAFTISRSSHTVKPSIQVELEHNGIIGYGEAAPSERYGETPATVIRFLEQVDLSGFSTPFALEAILSYTDSIAPGNTAAKASIDIALHDWIGKCLEMPLWKLWGLDAGNTPLSSFTIGIDTPEMIVQKVQEAERYPILKVKVGIPNDDVIIRTIRSVTGKPIRVDANEGWTSKELALEKIEWLAGQGVELIEQPMPAHQLDDIAWLRERASIPIIADESLVRASDLRRLCKAFDGVNIKLMKCAGIREAMKLIHAARVLDMKVMLGCMIESSVAIAAAANLSPLVDYTDLDGNVLITDDPFIGMENHDGRLVLSDRPGLGVSPSSPVA